MPSTAVSTERTQLNSNGLWTISSPWRHDTFRYWQWASLPGWSLSGAQFTPVGCQSRSSHKQKCKSMHKWTLTRMYLFSWNIGRPRAGKNTSYSIWVWGIKVIWAPEQSRGHQTQISWGSPKLPFLQGLISAAIKSKWHWVIEQHIYNGLRVFVLYQRYSAAAGKSSLWPTTGPSVGARPLKPDAVLTETVPLLSWPVGFISLSAVLLLKGQCVRKAWARHSGAAS